MVKVIHPIHLANNMKKYIYILIIILVVYGFAVLVSEAADEGANSPGTMADDATVGTVAWSNPDRAKSLADGNATAVLSSLGVSHYLKATNFGFSIPTGATIDGILAEINKNFAGGYFPKDNSVKIVTSDGTLGSEDKANTDNWPFGTYISYGASNDLWNESWSDTDINDADFGVVISAKDTTGNKLYPFICHIRITVYYTEAETSNPTVTIKSQTKIIGNMIIK